MFNCVVLRKKKDKEIHTSVVHAVCPSLAVWLAPLNRANIVRLAIVVPGQNLDDINCVSSLDKRLPALGVKMLVRQEDELQNQVSY